MKYPAQKPQNKRPVQPWEEPAEIAKTAFEQVGARPPQESPSNQDSIAPPHPPEPSPEEKRKHSMLEAFQRELEEINELQKKRREEMRQRWYDQEELKKQREEEAKKAKQPLVEPVTKKVRGVLAGMAGMVKKKQRSVEFSKTPTN